MELPGVLRVFSHPLHDVARGDGAVGGDVVGRGLGHQVCTDHVRAMDAVCSHYGIVLPDRQLACAPVRSPEGEAYLGAMRAAASA